MLPKGDSEMNGRLRRIAVAGLVSCAALAFAAERSDAQVIVYGGPRVVYSAPLVYEYYPAPVVVYRPAPPPVVYHYGPPPAAHYYFHAAPSWYPTRYYSPRKWKVYTPYGTYKYEIERDGELDIDFDD